MSYTFLNKGKLLVKFDKDTRNIIKTIQNVDGILLTEIERMYVHFIVSGLKSINVWTKIKALYGFVGGTAATHKWNWKDMRNLDAAFRITWAGGVTHNQNGIKGNGTNGYGNTHLIPFLHDADNSFISLYTSTGEFDNTAGPTEVGCRQISPNPQAGKYVNTKRLSGNIFYQINTNDVVQFSVDSGIGSYVFYSLSLRQKIVRNNMLISDTPFSQLIKPNFPVYLMARNINNLPESGTFSIKTIGFVALGDNISDLEAIQMSHIVTTAQGILGRK